MNLTFVRKYNRLLRRTDGIFRNNPLLVLGLALPLAVIPSYSLSGTVAVSLAMLICFIPTTLLACLTGRKLETCWKVVLYPFISSLLLIPARYLVGWISPLIFDTLGVYFSLICVNSLLMYTVQKVETQKPIQALAFSLRQWAGATLVALACGIIRELLAAGSIWGVVLLQDVPRLPVAQMAMGGFILLGFSAAFCRMLHRVILSLALKSGAAAEQQSLKKERGEQK